MRPNPGHRRARTLLELRRLGRYDLVSPVTAFMRGVHRSQPGPQLVHQCPPQPDIQGLCVERLLVVAVHTPAATRARLLGAHAPIPTTASATRLRARGFVSLGPTTMTATAARRRRRRRHRLPAAAPATYRRRRRRPRLASVSTRVLCRTQLTLISRPTFLTI